VKISKKAIGFLLAVVLVAGLICVYPLAAGDTVTIGDFEGRRYTNSTDRYTVIKNDNGHTVISYSGRTSWDAFALAAVNGYTAEKASEYTRLCFTATFTGINQLYIEIPYGESDSHVDLFEWNSIASGIISGSLRNIITSNSDGSYTFDIPLGNYPEFKQYGLSAISLFLDPDTSVARERVITILDIGFRKVGEKAGPQYGISLDQTQIVFPEAIAGYGPQTAGTVTITNTQTAATGILNIELSGDNPGSFTLSKSTVNGISPIGIPPAGTNSFTVVPNTGLEAGTYTATVTVSYQNVAEQAQSVSVSFTVKAVEFNIIVSAGTNGTVTGGGKYNENAEVTLTAKPNSGYAFEGWYENGDKIPGAGATYKFKASANTTLEAQFKLSDDGGGGGGGYPATINPTSPDESEILDDVPQDDATAKTIPEQHSPWARKELERALELDIIPLALLEPDIDLRRPISRIEFAGIALKAYENLANTTVMPVDDNPFTDTGDLNALRTLNVGIMVGFSQTEFSPHTELTREQAATVLTRVYKRVSITGWSFETDAEYQLVYASPAPFADDSDISNWARDSVYFMASNGIIRGVGYNIFAPRAVTSVQQAAGYALATREQSLIMALRIVEKEWE